LDNIDNILINIFINMIDAGPEKLSGLKRIKQDLEQKIGLTPNLSLRQRREQLARKVLEYDKVTAFLLTPPSEKLDVALKSLNIQEHIIHGLDLMLSGPPEEQDGAILSYILETEIGNPDKATTAARTALVNLQEAKIMERPATKPSPYPKTAFDVIMDHAPNSDADPVKITARYFVINASTTKIQDTTDITEIKFNISKQGVRDQFAALQTQRIQLAQPK
jgi:hypothetical protein